jgi:RHS repeat-associated protein
MLVSNGVYVVTDRLGSVRANTQGGSFAYYPYGEERTSTVNGLDKFATYFRDAVGQDYADQRYYSGTMGRFWTVDPGGIKTANSSDPTSWNRYAYVQGDPVNHTDRHGLFMCSDCVDDSDGDDGDDDAGAGLCDTNPLWCLVGGPAYGFNYPGPTSGGGGVSAAQAQWNSLSTPCQQALRTAMPGTQVSAMVAALNRAIDAESTLVAATNNTSISWMFLAAIGIRESGFQDMSEKDGAGVGVGVFQITVTSPPSGVTAAQAGNLTWAAGYAANMLNTNMAYLAKKFPQLTPAQLLQATAASYNFGTGNISGNPNTIDVGTAHNNYGQNVVQLTTCF